MKNGLLEPPIGMMYHHSPLTQGLQVALSCSLWWRDNHSQCSRPIANGLSSSVHIQAFISSCAQTMYALSSACSWIKW